MSQRKKPKNFLLKAAAIGGGSVLAACSSGPVAGTPVMDAGLSPDAAGHDAAVGVAIDAGSDATHGISVGDAGPDSSPVGTTIMDAGTEPDAGQDAGHVIGVIVHPDGGTP